MEGQAEETLFDPVGEDPVGDVEESGAEKLAVGDDSDQPDPLGHEEPIVTGRSSQHGWLTEPLDDRLQTHLLQRAEIAGRRGGAARRGGGAGSRDRGRPGGGRGRRATCLRRGVPGWVVLAARAAEEEEGDQEDDHEGDDQRPEAGLGRGRGLAMAGGHSAVMIGTDPGNGRLVLWH
jgi:hypothetical protein